jgi:hypothetical protein
LLFPLPSIFGLWNLAPSVGGRKKREFALFSFALGAFAFFAKARIRAFSFALGAFAFFAISFSSRFRALFSSRSRAQKREKSASAHHC